MYEVIVEPQEQPEQAKQEVHKDSAQGPVDPNSGSPKASPGACPIISNLWHLYIFLLLVH